MSQMNLLYLYFCRILQIGIFLDRYCQLLVLGLGDFIFYNFVAETVQERVFIRIIQPVLSRYLSMLRQNYKVIPFIF